METSSQEETDICVDSNSRIQHIIQRNHQKYVEDRNNRVTFEDHAKSWLDPRSIKELQDQGVPEVTYREILVSFYDYVGDIVAKEDLFDTLFPNKLHPSYNFIKKHGLQDRQKRYQWVMLRVLSKVNHWRTKVVKDWEEHFGSQFDPDVLERVRPQLWSFGPWTYPERQQEWTKDLVDHIEQQLK
eukprot:TRINITY_DN415_c0_g2_i2.p1 TRINITY_DN415_c0_g2~~TRINITY_DN415_c0_g2_i2.p1  ORF type:complete len:200 (-),score=32.15 TRINITY_DN415_c0_g2_i2:49-603(-)